MERTEYACPSCGQDDGYITEDEQPGMDDEDYLVCHKCGYCPCCSGEPVDFAQRRAER